MFYNNRSNGFYFFFANKQQLLADTLGGWVGLGLGWVGWIWLMFFVSIYDTFYKLGCYTHFQQSGPDELT